MVHNLQQTMKWKSKDISIHVPLYYTNIQTQKELYMKEEC